MSMENREDHVAFFKPETVVLLELIYHSISQILWEPNKNIWKTAIQKPHKICDDGKSLCSTWGESLSYHDASFWWLQPLFFDGSLICWGASILRHHHIAIRHPLHIVAVVQQGHLAGHWAASKTWLAAFLCGEYWRCTGFNNRKHWKYSQYQCMSKQKWFPRMVASHIPGQRRFLLLPYPLGNESN